MDVNNRVQEIDLKTIVGHTATVFTVLTFLTGLPVEHGTFLIGKKEQLNACYRLICKKIWKQGTTVDITSFPFIAGFVSASLWLQYGLFIHDKVVILVNAIGAALQLCYILCYYVFTPVKGNLHRQLLFVGVSLTCFYGYLNYIAGEKNSILISGLTACCGGLVFCGSPLASLAEVRKTRSVESLPFPLIFFSFIVTLLWFLYGVLVHDTFIQVPNLLGCIIAGMQLLLFLIYPSKKYETTTM